VVTAAYRYFSGAADSNDNAVKRWWHQKLANYFEFCLNLQRKVEVRVGPLLSLFVHTITGL